MTFSLQHVEREIANNAEKACRQAFEAIDGKIETGTIEQQHRLLYVTANLVSECRRKDRGDEAQRLETEYKGYVDTLREIVEKIDDPERKEELLDAISDTYWNLAAFGMVDDGIAVAKLSRRKGQYNVAEYLIDIARMVAHRDGFDKAVPILDDAVEAAEKLPCLSWAEREIVEVAKVYMEVGHRKKAEELIVPLSPGGRLSGVLMTLDILEQRGRDRERYPEILKQCEAIAEEIDGKDDRAQAFISIAYRYMKCEMPEEAEQLVDTKAQASVSREIDIFHWELGSYLCGNGRREDAEKQVDRIKDSWVRGSLMMSILRCEKNSADKATFQRLIKKTEPLVRDMKQMEAHRINHLFQLAAYKIKLGDEAEGRKMMDEIFAMPSPSIHWSRDSFIDRASTAFARAALYDVAAALIETIESPTIKGEAYRALESIYRDQEEPKEDKKRGGCWNILDESKSD